MASTIKDSPDRPFTSGAIDSGSAFWESYIASRPSPPESFFRIIQTYHRGHGSHRTSVAHDVGTGPGNIARRLLPYFDYVVGSDLNADALAVARKLTQAEHTERMAFIKSSAEELLAAPVPEIARPGDTDLVLVSECMPLLDAPKALTVFEKMLRPGGTLAIYFYGRPIFLGDNAAECNGLWARLADCVVQCFHPFKGTPSYSSYHRSAITLHSWLDNIELPKQSWKQVERIRWNPDWPLRFCGLAGYDFELEVVDRTQDGESKRVFDHDFWTQEMSAQQVSGYLSSVLPGYRDRPNAAGRLAEIDVLLQRLQEVMGGERATRKVTFPVSLILAKKRE
ncbi:S-adenosyl-L-methionine-dependent methyltransferase [Ustulina deusta]|nr:S-adenosyl-L-methionine-dependent methyltransferase [Ustulina deusta]